MVPREGTGRLLLLAAAVIATALAIAPAARGVEPARLKRYPLMDPRASSPGLPVADPPQKTSTARLPPVEELPPPLAPPTFENQGTDVPRSPLPPVPASGLEALEASVGQAGPCEEATYRGTYVPRSPGTHCVPYFGEDFGGDGICYELPYDPYGELDAYEGKQCIPTQRPWIEWGRPFYDWGQFPPGSTIFGDSNLAASQFLVFGDFRTAVATNRNGGDSTNLIAARLNLELDWKITSTERFHTSFQPMNKGQNFTNIAFSTSEFDFEEEFNIDPFTGFFEGDLGAIWGGMTGQVLPFDCPVAIGFMPLVFQNGIWMEDNTIGAAITIPARNSPLLDISNYDITFFHLFDDVSSPAFQGDENAARAYGVAGFFEMLEGYIELDYAYLEDRSLVDRGYHNFGVGYTRRYFGFLSNSVRTIANAGQDPNGIEPTADGVLLLLENSLITKDPYLFVPYCNLFFGFGRVQSVARNGAAGGILRNTGILFETDNLTGYPTLDPTGNETYGGAVGINLIPATIDRQLVVEYAFVGIHGDPAERNIRGNEHGVGVRFQQNLTNAWLFRADAMYGSRDNDDDLSGARMELRYKF